MHPIVTPDKPRLRVVRAGLVALGLGVACFLWFLMPLEKNLPKILPSKKTPETEPQEGKPKEIGTKNTDGLAHIIRGHSSDENSIKVTIVHNKSNPHSLNDSFIVTKDTHLIVTLSYAPFADGPSEKILSEDFTNIGGLPFTLEIAGELEKLFNKRLYNISAIVYNHSGNEVAVGDLVSEIITEVQADSRNIEVQVFGMEDCNAPNAGGFCTSNRGSGG